MQWTHSSSANRHTCYLQDFDGDRCDSSQDLQIVNLMLYCKAHMINVAGAPISKGRGGWGGVGGGSSVSLGAATN